MTSLDELRRRLTAVPDPRPAIDEAVEPAIADSVRYLGSDDAMRSLEADVYWPKWSSPWWHMLLLFEIGEARRIPERAVDKMIAALDAFPIKIFPVHAGDLPPTASPHRDVLCHCAVGSVWQVLAACGRDVERELPWFAPWFARYQMADGGLNCDDSAYRVDGECPSSMVGTIAPFEAMLVAPRDRWTAERTGFVERAAGFLVERRLMLGSPTVHNAEERARQVAWLAPCFPRFYFYDVLRGLAALVRWADITGQRIPLRAIAAVLDHLLAAFPDGVAWRQRVAFAATGTWTSGASGPWERRDLPFRCPLLDATSAIGPCPYLTRQWSATRHMLRRLLDGARIVDDL